MLLAVAIAFCNAVLSTAGVTSFVPTATILLIGWVVIELSTTLLVCTPSTVDTSVRIVRSPLTPSRTTFVWPLGRVSSFCSIVSKGTTSLVTFSSGFSTIGTLGPSSGVALCSGAGVTSFVPTATILLTGWVVIELSTTLLVWTPSTVDTSVRIVRSPLTPSRTTFVWPLGRVSSFCSIVSKGTTSLVTFSSGFSTVGTLGPSSGVVLYSGWGCGFGCGVGLFGFVGFVGFSGTVGFTWLGRVFKSLCVK